MIGIAVETVGAAHCHVLAALHAAGFARGWSAGEIAALLAAPGTFALLAADEGHQPVGMLLCRHAAGEAEVLTLAVAIDRRRAGAGTALLQAALDALPGDVGAVFVEVAETNSAAQSLYAATGFVSIGRRSAYYRTCAGVEDAIVMRRTLP